MPIQHRLINLDLLLTKLRGDALATTEVTLIRSRRVNCSLCENFAAA